jgi:hypothetical protein
MTGTTYYSYILPRIQIAEHDLSGNIRHVTLSITQVGGVESWQVSLDGVDEDAIALLHDLLRRNSAVNILVERKEPSDKRNPHFSGSVIINKLGMSSVNLQGTGPVDLKPQL